MGLTTQTSKRLVQRMMDSLTARKYEATLCKIAAHTSFTVTRLDLTIPEAAPLKKLIAEAVAQYEEDFNPASQLPTTIGTVDTSDRLPADPIVTVTMEEVALSDSTYRDELAKYDNATQSHKKRKLDDYLGANASIIVDDGRDIEKLKRKLMSLPVAAEKRRKLFVKDYMIEHGLDMERLREKRQSVFDPLKADITEDRVDKLFEIYRRLKSDGDDRKSADHMVLIVPGPPPNHWDNKHVAAAVKHLKKGLGLPPKVGRIEYPPE